MEFGEKSEPSLAALGAHGFHPCYRVGRRFRLISMLRHHILEMKCLRSAHLGFQAVQTVCNLSVTLPCAARG